MLAYLTRYRKYFPSDSWEYIWDELPMSHGYCYTAGAMMNDGWLQFSGIVLSDGGFVKQELENILKRKKN